MGPVIHTLLQLALSVVGGVAGNRLGAAIYHEEAVKSLVPHLSLPRLVGFLAGFFVVFVIWDRFVPLNCPVPGLMKIVTGMPAAGNDAPEAASWTWTVMGERLVPATAPTGCWMKASA